MIETSYFASQAPQSRKVCIAKWNRWWKGTRAPLFAPSNPKAANWKEAYKQDMLERFPTPKSLQQYLAEIERIVPNPILCCFEANAGECHRRILAAFIEEKLGVAIPEWEDTSSPTQYRLL